MKSKASFPHYITMAPLTVSIPEFFPEVPFSTQLNQAKEMSNPYIWNCFPCQKLQLFSNTMKPKASFPHYITMAPLTDSMPEFFPVVTFPTQLNQAKIMSNPYIWNCFPCQKLQLFSKVMKPKASFPHYITMAPLTDSMPEFFPEVPFPTQLKQANKMSNTYNWNCFSCQKLQSFSKASFVHFHVKFNNILIRNQWGSASQN